jgi:hypothetical protein
MLAWVMTAQAMMPQAMMKHRWTTPAIPSSQIS